MIEIDGYTLKLEDVYAVALNKTKVSLSVKSKEIIKKHRKIVEKILGGGKAVYGINTGVGRLAEVKIPGDELAKLQVNIVRSHAVGVGDPLTPEIVRAAMLLRANTLASGHAGVRPGVVEKLIEFLNKDVIPYVPSQGSVGASGDLAPLAHIALALIGEGYCLEEGKKIPTLDVLKKKQIAPLKLQAKEGLSLINGTQATTAVLSLTIKEAEVLTTNADIIAALTFEALEGIREELDPRICEIRPHKGQTITLNLMRKFVENSRLSGSEKKRVQDAYSLRCTPQVHGTVRDTLDFARKIVETEINSVTDNPLVFDNGDIISNGNFHGQYPGMIADFMSISLATLGNISERRSFRLLTPELSGLPAFLVKERGLNSGFMMMQVTQASLVSYNKVLAHPSTVDSIPTSANQEDFVSMGMNAALKMREVFQNTRKILAIELIFAAQALEMKNIEMASHYARMVVEKIRAEIPHLDRDRFMYEDLTKAENLLKKPLLDVEF